MERATTTGAAQARQGRCPLCGADNGCAMAAGHNVNGCWCLRAVIDPQALAALPADDAGRRCLCSACGRLQGELSLER
ncbi:MAG: cysteine-rich CWC family protein [Halioglobus sp.]|nr:cysteine-rich CWC family protein [Halioglobus sp.]